MNRILTVFNTKKNILNIYLTAGYPNLNDTQPIVTTLEKAGVDMVEIGMPFSDPLADGETIQKSSAVAIENGITIQQIFNQILEIRKTVSIPIILMGYYNQVLKYGAIDFFNKAKEVGVDGIILPDLPIEIYEKEYKELTEKLQLSIIFLITPQTSIERIKKIDALSSGFLYMVSSYAITGNKNDITDLQLEYFKKVQKIELKNPTLIGFGISDNKSFNIACKFANGAIIGSAFIKTLENSENLEKSITNFIKKIK